MRKSVLGTTVRRQTKRPRMRGLFCLSKSIQAPNKGNKND